MPSETQIDARRDFVRGFLPWVVAAGMLAVYALTLNRWVSLFNLGAVATLSDWTWLPELNNPVFYLVTLPFRLLPAQAIPAALNIFSAMCAALTLALLARSVALLPQDRTEAQRSRERNDYSLLTIWSAWLPPVLAALLCGLQLTFWECATNGSSEMLDLLLFAFVVWLLLEYRLDEREGRLYLAAAVVGAGMAEDWAMAGFFPVFIVALVWIRGLSFFNLRFLGRMALCGLAGMLLFLLLPLVAVSSVKAPVPFWQALGLNAAQPYHALRLYFLCLFHPGLYFEDLLMPLFISLMPLFVLSIRWKTAFDNSRLGLALANFMFHSIHAIFLGVCVWLAFDPPFSPREKGFGLTLYYLIALSSGYYAGYFLLIFGKKSPGATEHRPLPLKILSPVLVLGVWLLGILATAGLIYKNTPVVRAANGDALQQYASQAISDLPREGGILLSDDDPRRLILTLTQAALAREGRVQDFLTLDTRWLPFPQYHRYLHEKFPQKWPLLVTATQTNALNPLGLIAMLNMLGKSNALYYLHPSFGYYFEQFYAEPHGLVYKLKLLPNDTLLPPPPDKNLIAENEAFWSDVQTRALPDIANAVAPEDANAPQTFCERQLARLHIPREANSAAVLTGTFYSRSLDFWGVELQRAGDLGRAAADFETALRFNPDNVVAQINLRLNGELRAGGRTAVDLSQTTPDHLGQYNSMTEAIAANGPFDEPGFCFEYGFALAQDNGYMRQAAGPLERVRKLDPDYLPARMWLAQIYALNRLPDRALDALRAPMEEPERFSLNEANSAQVNVLAAAVYFQKNDTARGTRLLETEISRNPTDDALLVTVAQMYMSHGLYSQALAVAQRKLRVSPDDPNWLFTEGYIDIQLTNYDDAIATLTRVLAIQKNNSNALFNRAIANLRSGNLDAGRTDYKKLQQLFPHSFQVAYGLGEIAWRKHETNEAIGNYEIYLTNARTNTAEARTVNERLRELKQ